MKRKKYKAGKLFNKFLKITLGNYMRLLFDYSGETSRLKGLKPPYIVLANHTNFWDPFLLSMFFPDPVYFVTSDAYFRNPVLKRLLKLVGAIPKTKFVTDPLSIRGILEVIRDNGIVGLFPEGRRSWDGKTLPLLYPTAKLIKALNVPVVSVLFQGACLSMPRWADSTRKGKLVMKLSRVLEPQDVKQLAVDEIYKVITDALTYDEYEYQREQRNPYKGRNLAQKLELYLFCCPECGRLGTLSSSGNTLGCRNCSYKVTYNKYGFLETENAKLHFDNPRDWNVWQLERLDSLISSKIAEGRDHTVFYDENIILRTGQKTGALGTGSGNGLLTLFPDRIEYRSENGVFHNFPIEDIIGVNIQLNNQLEFISNSITYRFSSADGTLSAYKWVKAIGALKLCSPKSGPHTADQLLTE